MVRVTILFAVLLSSLAVFALSTDITGKWVGKMQGPDGDMEMAFNFVAKGDSLSGSVQSPMGELPISNGKIDGDKFSFDISFNDMKMTHQCTILGDSISMKMPGMQGGDGIEIILKRAEEGK
jgi:hypothetical protein